MQLIRTFRLISRRTLTQAVYLMRYYKEHIISNNTIIIHFRMSRTLITNSTHKVSIRISNKIIKIHLCIKTNTNSHQFQCHNHKRILNHHNIINNIKTIIVSMTLTHIINNMITINNSKTTQEWIITLHNTRTTCQIIHFWQKDQTLT